MTRKSTKRRHRTAASPLMQSALQTAQAAKADATYQSQLTTARLKVWMTPNGADATDMLAMLAVVLGTPCECGARQCAELLHQHLPEHFPTAADVVRMWNAGTWWALVDVTLRMLKPKELFKAQGFPEGYVIHEIPDPRHLFKDGRQSADPLHVPRIPLSATSQVRMCGNSVSPHQAEALARSNFAHEALI